MSYNFATMYQATPIFVDLTSNTDNRRVRKPERVLRYAEDKYHCEFSEDFREKILDGYYESFRIPEEKVIDALVKEWEVWKPYVSSESYSGFIEDGLKSIIQIKATATFHSSALNGYIGNKAKVIKELPTILATCVSAKGVLCINGRPV